MKRFKNILLVIEKESDDQQSAFHQAVTLAANNQAKITIIDLIEEIPKRHLHFLGKLFSQELDQEVVNTRREYLQSLTRSSEQEIDLIVRKTKGAPSIEIIRTVLKGKYDLVIKTSQVQRSLKTLLLGSTDMQLLRKCPCPVCIIKSGDDLKFQRILAAVDIEPSSDDQKMDDFNLELLEMATELAFSESCELHIVHAWLVLGQRMLDASRIEAKQKKIEAWIRDQKNEIEIRQRQLKENLDLLLKKKGMESLHPEIHMVEGVADDVIPLITHEKQVDLIVMGTVGRSGLSGLLMGNTAEQILSQINCSVLAVKPPGFVSPVS